MVKQKIKDTKTLPKKKDKKSHPWKGLRKSRNNQEFFGILFFLITFYAAILGSIIKVLKNFSIERKFEIATNSSGLFVGYILLGIGIVVGIYLVLLIFIGALEISVHNKLFGKTALKVRTSFRELVFGSTTTITANAFLLSFYLIFLLWIYFKPEYVTWAILFILGYLTWNTFLFLHPSQPIKSIIKSCFIKWKHNFKNWLYVSLGLIFIMILALSIFMIVINESAKYSINLDKESYFLGEDVYVEIFPEGLTKPLTLNVTYSNQHLPLNYISDENYLRAPTYVKIPKEYLTPEPYNSIIIIDYKLGNPFLEKVYNKNSKKFFIPVFNETFNSSRD